MNAFTNELQNIPMNISRRFFSCIAHPASNGDLLLGSEKTAFIDCGMAFCAAKTIAKAEAVLKGRPLDYVFATHAHYDHIAALPYFRRRWPGLKLVISAIGAEILQKPTPRRVFRELSRNAWAEYCSGTFDDSGSAGGSGLSDNAGLWRDYDDDAFYADSIIGDREQISLGDITVTALATPGHTRDCLCFFAEEPGLLILCETLGVLMDDGNIDPSYLTGYGDALAAIEKCSCLPWRYLSAPHRGLLTDREARCFFVGAREAAGEYCDFICGRHRAGKNADEILTACTERYYKGILAEIQPKAAFLMNMRATVNCTLREFFG